MQMSEKKILSMDLRSLSIFLLALLLPLGTAFAGGSSEEEEENAVSVAKGMTEEISYGPGEWRTYSPKITVNVGFPHDINSDTFTAMANAGEPYDNNRWIELYRDTVGVETVYKLIAPNSADYDQKLILGMSSGDLPDIFRVSDLSLYNQLCEAGVIADLTDIYAAEANPTLKGVVEGEGSSFLNSFMYNERLYGIPGKMPSTNGYNYLWIRKDWLDKLGLSVPKTMDDVKAVAKAFKELDPDGNGKDDTNGLVIDSAYVSSSAKGIFWAFGGQPDNNNYWKTSSDGSVEFSLVQPEMKKGLAWLQDMYGEGLINEEFATVRVWDSNITSGFANNATGMFYGHHWYSIWLNSTKEDMSPDAEWIPYLPPTETGEPGKVYTSIDFAGVYVVNAEFEHPEALMAMFNAYTEKLFGKNAEFGKYFANEINGTLWQCGPIHMLSADVDIIPHREMKKALADGTLETLGGLGGDYWKLIKDGLLQYNYMFGPEDSCFNLVDETYPDIMVWNGYRGAPTPTMSERWSSMQEIIDATYLKIIYGELSVDEGFDEMVDKWNGAGGMQVTEEINEIVDSYAE